MALEWQQWGMTGKVLLLPSMLALVSVLIPFELCRRQLRWSHSFISSFHSATLPLKEEKNNSHKGHNLWIWLLFPVSLNVLGVSSPGQLPNDNNACTDLSGHPPLSVRVSGRNGGGQNVDVTKRGCSTPDSPSNAKFFTLFPAELSEGLFLPLKYNRGNLS